LPPEYQEIKDDVDQAVEVIDNIDEQVDELKRHLDDWANKVLPEFLKKGSKKVQEKIKELEKRSAEELQKLYDEIPDLTSNREVCD
jgi:gas vesicle protein